MDGTTVREQGHLAAEPQSAPVSWQAWWMQADEYTVLSLLQPEASLHGAKAGVNLPTISDSVHHPYFTHLITSQQDRKG